ncbi:hypothetical protein AMEX_G18329 [Astyanax mexicanus]|uniref:Uncharacterized protein n=1 Tax=Astyanax mexicanus TaxID=7994 RepID=A0A8T2L8Y9_ASTMX|nr:hypothetical protein AMEX_G18329 [Astyanax mexicanus]
MDWRKIFRVRPREVVESDWRKKIFRLDPLQATTPVVVIDILQKNFGVCPLEAQEPSMADLTTTSFPEPSQQEDPGLPPPPSTSTQGRSVKRLSTTINTIFSPLCFRSRRRVHPDPRHRLDLQGTLPEPEQVPAAQRGRLQRFLPFLRRMVRR